jgi:hypothetical protein
MHTHLRENLLKGLAVRQHSASIIHLAFLSRVHAAVQLGPLLGLLEAVRLRVHYVFCSLGLLGYPQTAGLDG